MATDRELLELQISELEKRMNLKLESMKDAIGDVAGDLGGIGVKVDCLTTDLKPLIESEQRRAGGRLTVTTAREWLVTGAAVFGASSGAIALLLH